MSAGETKGVMHVILHMSLMRVAERQFSDLKPINQEIGRMAIHIGRREILCTLASAAVAWPLAARAQEVQRPGKLWRIGVLSGLTAPSDVRSTVLGGFLLGMQELGYIENRDFIVEWRFAGGRYERFPELASELVRLHVDVVLVSATAGIRAMQQATKSIPIVMGFSFDPVGNGLVTSLAHPGGNTTGLATAQQETVAKQVELIKMVVPRISRLAIMVNPNNSNSAGMVPNAEAAAREAGLQGVVVKAGTLQEVERAFAMVTNERIEALLTFTDSVFTTYRRRIAELALQSGLPTVFAQREPVEAGGLMSYGESLTDFLRRSATYVDRILKGAKPGDLPIEQPNRYFLVINLKTARELGLEIPPTLLALADEVIE
jgi:putative ABC transport system substrate-binding protein